MPPIFFLIPIPYLLFANHYLLPLLKVNSTEFVLINGEKLMFLNFSTITPLSHSLTLSHFFHLGADRHPARPSLGRAACVPTGITPGCRQACRLSLPIQIIITTKSCLRSFSCCHYHLFIGSVGNISASENAFYICFHNLIGNDFFSVI